MVPPFQKILCETLHWHCQCCVPQTDCVLRLLNMVHAFTTSVSILQPDSYLPLYPLVYWRQPRLVCGWCVVVISQPHKILILGKHQEAIT